MAPPASPPARLLTYPQSRERSQAECRRQSATRQRAEHHNQFRSPIVDSIPFVSKATSATSWPSQLHSAVVDRRQRWSKFLLVGRPPSSAPIRQKVEPMSRSTFRSSWF